MMASRELPSREDLVDFGHAVAGHAGTMSDPEGELFIKPCVQKEIEFYQSANRRHAEFAALMPLFMGTLSLSDAADVSDESTSAAGSDPDNVVWNPNKSRKIQTDQALVLENSTAGFKQPNILDAKLGIRLWADDAPLQKKQRFDRISQETTHKNLGFRIAGMRIWKGSDDEKELGEDGYRTYDKDYGRLDVTDETVVENFRHFVFNSRAGIDEALGKAVCKGFVRELKRIVDVMSRHESRMYSASVLFVYEGDGAALEKAIQENNRAVDEYEKPISTPERINHRVDSGIGMEEDDLEDEESPSLPKIFACKLIDFAHASWTPGQGPDENSLVGVRSLLRIMEELAR